MTTPNLPLPTLRLRARAALFALRHWYLNVGPLGLAFAAWCHAHELPIDVTRYCVALRNLRAHPGGWTLSGVEIFTPTPAQLEAFALGRRNDFVRWTPARFAMHFRPLQRAIRSLWSRGWHASMRPMAFGPPILIFKHPSKPELTVTVHHTGAGGGWWSICEARTDYHARSTAKTPEAIARLLAIARNGTTPDPRSVASTAPFGWLVRQMGH